MAESIDTERAAGVLEELLRTTAAAHGIYEREQLGGVYDEQWPTWYASFVARALAEHGYALTR
ncbi:hypothetical protein [Microbacterium sp. K35]|uniref:hypothetical protein n=1 Tax=Microbacterium sp. K35 TaxID=2305440 RepID=UPI00109B9E29|nr:hypothetical protein [Microbacterium sp. K35]